MKKLLLGLALLSAAPAFAAQTLSVSSTAEAPYNGADQTTLAASQSILIAKGETRGLWLKVGGTGASCFAFSTSGVDAHVTTSFFTAESITPTNHSYTGAATTYLDKLIPLTGSNFCADGYAFVDIAVDSSATAGSQTLTITLGSASVSVTLNILSLTMPSTPSYPMYAAVRGSAIDGAIGDGGTDAVQCSATNAAVTLARAHGVEPYLQNVFYKIPLTGSALNLSFDTANRCDWTTANITGHIAPIPVVMSVTSTGDSNYPSVTEQGDINTALLGGTFGTGAWAYVADEGEGNSGLTAQFQAVINAYKTNMPNVPLMTTRENDGSLTNIDIWYPVMDYFGQTGHQGASAYSGTTWGLYGSCMAQGSCSGTGASTATGTPLMVADAPSVNQLAYMLMSPFMGGSRTLYYSFTDAYTTIPWNSNAHGNGDGTLLYPLNNTTYSWVTGTTYSGHQYLAGPSVRLKMLREGRFLAEYFKLNHTPFSSLITNTKSWDHTYAHWQTARDTVANAYTVGGGGGGGGGGSGGGSGGGGGGSGTPASTIKPSLKSSFLIPDNSARTIDSAVPGSAKVQLGAMLTYRRVYATRCQYDFSKQGGAVGVFNLFDLDGKACHVPGKAIIKNLFIDVLTAPTSGGAATLELSTGQTPADLKAATAYSSFSGIVGGIPDHTAGNAVKILVARNTFVNPVLTVGTAALTAGKLNVMIEYVMGE